MTERYTLAHAQQLDEQDKLASFRDRFHIPLHKDGQHKLYFSGNSLGLMPKQTRDYLDQELHDWETLGVKGHLNAARPWVHYHHQFKEPLAKLTGARPSEVVIMNSLTTNLHLLMVSFYRPTVTKYKIMMLANAFPSDQYAVASQVAYHGHDPAEAIIRVGPDASEGTLEEDDVVSLIAQHQDELAMVLVEGVSYITGQCFDLAKIGKACTSSNVILGADLAHAIGNVALSLHDDDVDFAVWCSYKYLNGSPGAVAGAFVHDRHGQDFSGPRFQGWWGHNEEKRFLMDNTFDPMPGVDGWQLSNVPIMSSAALLSSLHIFEEAGFDNLVQKSKALTSYLYTLISQGCPGITITTPEDSNRRGCQLSLVVEGGKKRFEALMDQGVICDWREPNVIRLAPVPLYNRFQDVFLFYQMIKAES